jgi:hypothetical protein
MLSRLELIPTNISNDLAKLNQAVLHPDTYAKVKHPKQEKVYIKVKDFILTSTKSSEIPPDKIGISKKVREFLFVNMINPILVEGYVIPNDKETGLSFLEF